MKRAEVLHSLGTPALRKMLHEQGYMTAHERGVQLWKMFAETYRILGDISREIEATEKEQ